MPASPFSYWGWRLTLAFSEHSRRHLFTPDSLCWLESCVQTVYLYMPCLKMSKLYSASEGKQQENQVVRYLRLRYFLLRQINIQQMMQSKALNSAIRKCSLTLLHCLAYVFSVPLSQSALLILRSYLALIQYRQNFWDNIYLCVRYLLSRNMREDLKRSLSDDKVSLSAHLSILPETPLLIWLVKVADSLFALEMRCKYGRAWTGVHWGQQGPWSSSTGFGSGLQWLFAWGLVWVGWEGMWSMWQDHCRGRMVLYWGWKMELSPWNEWIVQFLFCNPGNN